MVFLLFLFEVLFFLFVVFFRLVSFIIFLLECFCFLGFFIFLFEILLCVLDLFVKLSLFNIFFGSREVRFRLMFLLEVDVLVCWVLGFMGILLWGLLFGCVGFRNVIWLLNLLLVWSIGLIKFVNKYYI